MSERISEKIEFLTQTHTSWDDTEQRVALRGRPRRYISYEYIGMNTKQSQYLRALTCGTQTQILQFPLWHANRLLTKKIYDGQSTIKLTPEEIWSYRDCAGVMLWTNDEGGGEYFTLQNVTADGVLHLAKQVSSDWESVKSTVVPVFWGILQQEDNYANLTSEHTNMVINVEFINRGLNIELPAAIDEYNYPRPVFWQSKNAPSQYMGKELFMMPPTWQDDLTMNYSRNANRLDNQTGVIRYDLKSSDTTEVRVLGYNAISREEVQFLQRFFYRCKGAFKSFYAPSWIHDIELVQDTTSGATLITKFDLYWKYYASNKRRRILMVFFVNGTVEILKIAGFSREGGYGKVFLDTPLKRALYKKEIRMISFLCLYRFNGDALSIDYETTSAGVIKFEFAEVTD